LAERVIDGRTGFLIDGAIEEPLVQRLFAEKTIALLSDESLRSKMAVAAQEFIRPLACDDVARQWERIAL